MKKCSYCGRENDDASEHCTECGQELTAPASEAVDPVLEDPALSLVRVATFPTVVEADMARARLEAAGIEAIVPDEYAVQMFPYTGFPMFTVCVAARDYEEARRLLAGDSSEPPVQPN